MTVRYPHLVEPDPEPTVSDLAPVSVPDRIRARAFDIITAGETLKRVIAGPFTTDAQLARAKLIIARLEGRVS